MPTTHAVTSQDGTVIRYTTIGAGPGIIIIPGNNRMAHHYTSLATGLSDSLTVHVIERRGRGESGPQGDNYTIDREIEDVRAIIDATGSTNIFGHSYGGLVALQLGRIEPRVRKIIAYEPVVSINGSFDLSWLPEFEAAFGAGQLVKATAIFLKKANLSVVSTWPTPLLYLLSVALLSGKSGREMRDLMPTTPAEIRETQLADSDGNGYRTISAGTLLLGGEKGAAPLLKVLPELQKIIPHASYTILHGLNHNSPDLGPVKVIVDSIKSYTTTNKGA